MPHSSTNILLNEGFIVDENSYTDEILKLTDWYTDDLFYSDDNEIIKADFLRIFCDPERFADDLQEVMAKYGMGILYERNDDGETIRKIIPELSEKILTDYYWKHHEKLSKAVNNQLNLCGNALIIDCHSFPSNPLKRDLDKSPNRPDFNSGTDSYHTPKELINLSVSFFKNAGYSLGIDWP